MRNVSRLMAAFVDRIPHVRASSCLRLTACGSDTSSGITPAPVTEAETTEPDATTSTGPTIEPDTTQPDASPPTATSDDQTNDPEPGQPAIISAFYGLDDAIRPGGGVFCPALRR
jgi:hypothetical protein